MNCKTCNKITSNPKFCSKSCANYYSNKISPRRKPKERFCSKCGQSYYRSSKHRSVFICTKCKQFPDYKSMTIQDFIDQLSVKGKHPSWKFVRIRQFGRFWNSSLQNLPCFKCGYDKHVELAHIKPISSFPLSATLGEINSPENIVQLCPNCHWEFDNGLISIS